MIYALLDYNVYLNLALSLLNLIQIYGPIILSNLTADLSGTFLTFLINNNSCCTYFIYFVGRSYLSGNPALMNVLIKCMKAEDCDTLTRGMILGTLQKLSLR